MVTETFTQELVYHFKARTPCIWINSLEEKRAEQLVLRAYREARSYGFAIYWSIGFGGQLINILNNRKVNTEEIMQERDPFRVSDAEEEYANIPPNSSKLFNRILNTERETLYIIRDYPDFARMLTEQRMIRDIYERNINNSNVYAPLVIISTNRNIPISLQKLFVALDLDLMKESEIAEILDAYCAQHNLSPSEQEKFEVVKASCGLTKMEIGRIFNFSLQKEKRLDPKIISEEKVTAVKKSSIITYIEPRKTLDSVGGHPALKEWIKSIKACMTPEAEEFGVKAPKGTIFMGPGGLGKTAIAEAIANYFEEPLIIFDISRIMGGLVGESETHARRTFETIKSVGRCVVLIDECDKQFGNGGMGSSAQADAGTMGRVFGVVLQNLQENEGQFYILTANDISNLPGPLTRAGRLETKWYFEFPSKEERKDIFKIYFAAANKEISEKLLDYAASVSNNYTGAEIEIAVNNICRYAFFRKTKGSDGQINQEDILKGIQEVSTIYKNNAAEINALKTYATQNSIRSTSALDINLSGNNSIEQKDDFISTYLKSTGKSV